METKDLEAKVIEAERLLKATLRHIPLELEKEIRCFLNNQRYKKPDVVNTEGPYLFK